jgi:hypothetical protein
MCKLILDFDPEEGVKYFETSSIIESSGVQRINDVFHKIFKISFFEFLSFFGFVLSHETKKCANYVFKCIKLKWPKRRI